jgi:tetratricopeptide (TPR) repeat protein
MAQFGFRAAAAVAASLMALVAAPAQAEWLEAKSENFVVIGDMSETELRKRTEQLEQYHGMLAYLLNVKKAEPVTIYIVEGISAVQDALGGGAGGVAGFYSATAQRAFAVSPEKLNFYQEDFSPRIILLHEYAHHMLLSNVDMFMPGWAQEGLAEMFATAKLEDDGSVVIGDKNDSRADTILGMSRWSVRRMLDSDLNPPKNTDENIEKYARGWALAHYLWLSGERPNQYGDFIAELNRTVDPVASGEKVFGDLSKLDSELDRYIRLHRFKLSRFSPDLIGTPGVIAVRPLTEPEKAILNYRIAVSVRTNEDLGKPVAAKARAIGARYPDSAHVQAWMAEIEYDAENYDASLAAAERALAQDPDNIMALLYKGRVGMRRAVEASDQAMAKEARSWILRANKLDPDYALPFRVYYDSFWALGQTPPKGAVDGLLNATVLVPQDPALRIRGAIELLREGNPRQARSLLAPAAFVAEEIGENDPLKLMREMERTLDTAALLAKAKELKLDQVNEFAAPEDEDEKGNDKSKVLSPAF